MVNVVCELTWIDSDLSFNFSFQHFLSFFMWSIIATNVGASFSLDRYVMGSKIDWFSPLRQWLECCLIKCIIEERLYGVGAKKKEIGHTYRVIYLS